VGRAAFKMGSTPWAIAMPSHSPHASRSSTFRAPGWGAPAFPSSCCCWRSATSRGLAPFSHRSTSRIFIVRPDCIPHQWSSRMMTISSVVGRSEPGCGLCPALSFKDLHHPCCGGGQAEPGFYLPHGPATRFFLRRSGQRGILQLCGGGVLQPCGGRRTAAVRTRCSCPSSTPGGGRAARGWLLSPAS
jgi:hypothetical protein